MSESSRTPSERYDKSRRHLIVYSGLLLLIHYAAESLSSPIEIVWPVSFQLHNAAISVIFSLMTCYAAWQYFLNWSLQSDEVRSSFTGWSDCLITGALTVFSILASNLICWFLGFLLMCAWGIGFIGGTTYLKKIIAQKLANEDAKILRLLQDNSWILAFSPGAPPNIGQKAISFKRDGAIGDGKNDNENKWRVVDGYLELLNKEEKIFNRFKYDESSRRFESTHDNDTVHKAYQYIYQKDAPSPHPSPTRGEGDGS
jgi:hypothetical protein